MYTGCLPEDDGPDDTIIHVKESSESQMIPSYMVRMMQNMTGDYTSS